MVVMVVLVFMLNAVVDTVVVLTLAGVEEMFLVMVMLITM